MNLEQIADLVQKQGEAFEEFKKTHLEEIKKADVVTVEKLERIERSLDDAAETKAALEQAIEAEKKEREDLEARINREGIQADSEADAKKRVNLIDLNHVLASNAKSRNRSFEDLDLKQYDEYRAASLKWIREGKENLSPEEVKTMSVGSDPDGGYFVTPDTSGRIVSKIFETSPMRGICSQMTISTDKLEGIEDLNEAGAGYAGETSQSGDTTTPQVGKWEIPVWWIDTEPKVTQQLLDDAAVDIEAWLGNKVANKLGRFENAEFVAGDTAKIRGLTSYDIAADSGSGVDWGTLGYAVSGASGAFASSNPADKIHDLVGLLKNEYLSNARFLTRRSVITAVRKFKDGQGQYLWQPSLQMGQPEMLVGYPITRAEDMPALAADSKSLMFGDFREGYTIVDRVGIRVLRDNLTAKPYVKFYTTKRTGGGVLNFEAIKVMKFGTS
jgi:HK97 family phage major capsid protein